MRGALAWSISGLRTLALMAVMVLTVSLQVLAQIRSLVARVTTQLPRAMAIMSSHQVMTMTVLPRAQGMTGLMRVLVTTS